MGENLVRLLIAAALLLAACGPPPVPKDPTKDAWYGAAIAQLDKMNHDADAAFHDGKGDQAAALIKDGQPIVKRLLDVPHPTLPAIEAAADLDDLYGRMLFSNRHFAWARLQFQKNHARWKTWDPPTPETRRRLKLANDQIAECDRKMVE